MDDIFYLVHVVPEGTKIYDAYDRITKKQQVQYECDDFISKYGGVLKTNPRNLSADELDAYPGVYTTIINKYNFNKIDLFHAYMSGACVLILSKTLLLQKELSY